MITTTADQDGDWEILDSETGDRFRVAWMGGDHAAYVLTGSEGFHLSADLCMETARRLVELAGRRGQARNTDGGGWRNGRQRRAIWRLSATSSREPPRRPSPGPPPVSRADIEKAVLPHIVAPGNGTQDLIDDLYALVSGTDRAVLVVRESDLPEVLKSSDGENWRAGTHSWLTCVTASELRESIPMTLGLVAAKEAVARAIEAEQAVDPVEAKAREIAEAMALTIVEENIGGHTAVSALDALARSAARHVLGQEATR